MSAWAALVNVDDDSDEWLELCNEAMVELQRDAGQRIAREIAKLSENTSNDGSKRKSLCGEYWEALDMAEAIAREFFGGVE